MSYPGPLTPGIFSTQDTRDDDGQVIDNFFIETDAPPDLKDATQPIDPPKTKEPKRLTRILSRQYTLDPLNNPGNTPIQLLPADANRHGVGIRTFSPTLVATDGIRVASDLGEVFTAGMVLHNQVPPGDALSEHTGALYAVMASAVDGATIASAKVYVWIWAVTE